MTSPATARTFDSSAATAARSSAPRASMTIDHPRSFSERAIARPEPTGRPGDERDWHLSLLGGDESLPPSLYLKLTSSQGTGIAANDGSSDGRRGGRAQWLRCLRPTVLRARRTDRGDAHGGQPAPVRARRAASTGLHPSGSQRRAHSRRGTRQRSTPCPRAGRRPAPTGPGCRTAGGRVWIGRSGPCRALRDGLDSCIGCGCLSLKRCAISNPVTSPRPRAPERSTYRRCCGGHRTGADHQPVTKRDHRRSAHSAAGRATSEAAGSSTGAGRSR